MPTKLTKRTVDALKPGPRRVYLFDSELAGVGVSVTPSGSRTFFVQYRAGSGRRAPKRRLTIGRFGVVTVEEARQRARP